MDGFSKVIIAVGLAVFSIFLAGFVATKLWLWFLVPLFKLPEIGWAQGVALIITVRYFSGNLNSEDNSDGIVEQAVGMVLYPLAILAIAWILKHYI